MKGGKCNNSFTGQVCKPLKLTGKALAAYTMEYTLGGLSAAGVLLVKLVLDM